MLVFEEEGMEIFPQGYLQYLSVLQQRAEDKVRKVTEKPKKVGDKKQERVRKARIGEVERSIESLEQTLEGIHQSLLEEEVYANPERCMEVNEQMQLNEQELDELMLEWEELMA